MFKEKFQQAKFLLLFILGLGSFLAGLLVFFQDWRDSKGSLQVEGIVITADLSADREKGYRWDLTVRYWSKDGKPLEVPVHSSSSTQYQPGMTLSLLVDPKDPGQGKINDPWEIWGPSLLALGVGGLMLGYLFL